MQLKLENTSPTPAVFNIAISCPHCSHNGTFEQIGVNDITTFTDTIKGREILNSIGLRKCPNKNCHGYLFYIGDNKTKSILLTYPSEAIPFNKDGIPVPILNAFTEAIKCHSGQCYIASAIMIRKTLEEVCFERGSKGDNLKKKLTDLGQKILIPRELIEGMDELRLLGNDAAHLEARVFNEIGDEEIRVSIYFTQEILKAVYQYENLLQKLRALKKLS